MATVKRKDEITTLESLQHSKATKSKEEMAETSIMFKWLITVATRENDLGPIFEFELIFEPMSLFKNAMVRKPDKPSLRKVIMCDEGAVRKEDIENPDNYVLDAGALLHRVRWFKEMKFNAVSEVYANYMRKNYRGCITVACDGYRDEESPIVTNIYRKIIFLKATMYISTKRILCRLRKIVFQGIRKTKPTSLIFFHNI